MKRELITLFFAVIAFLMVLSLTTNVLGSECEYDADFDNDADYVMREGVACGIDYHYDCDDNDRYTWKDCDESDSVKNSKHIISSAEKDSEKDEKESSEDEKEKLSFWQRIKNFFKGKSQESMISGKSVTEKVSDTLKSSVAIVKPYCAANICYNSNNQEIYCPGDFDKCADEYSMCRIVPCDDECLTVEDVSEEYDYVEQDSGEYYSTETVDYNPEESGRECTEEYNDCYDDGVAITCKGAFVDCDASFQGCICGSSEEIIEEAKADYDSGIAPDCDTGIYVCHKFSLAMDGTPTTSKVTCKSSFTECSMLYGECECGDSSLTDFGTKRIGDAGGDAETASGKCEFCGDMVPCYMIVEDPKLCSKSTHTCKDGDRWLQCDGSKPYCDKLYDAKCLCGVENLGYGDFVTEG